MSSVHIIYHLARADFLERIRRYSFLVMLGLAVFLGYQTAVGNMALELGLYRGEQLRIIEQRLCDSHALLHTA